MPSLEFSVWPAKIARRSLDQAPIADLNSLCPPGPIAIVAPHPDDETLGCGGLMALAAAAGRSVLVAILTDGRGSHPASRLYPPLRLVEQRASESRRACAILTDGKAKVLQFMAEDGRLAGCERRAVAWLAQSFEDHGVRSAFVTWSADPHPDHQTASRVVAKVASRQAIAAWSYPIWGLTLPDEAPAGPVAPCRRLDIRDALASKAAAIAAYESQVGDLIADDPRGFRLSAADIGRHLRPYESFLRLECGLAGARSSAG